jgi:hypothetical protein
MSRTKDHSHRFAVPIRYFARAMNVRLAYGQGHLPVEFPEGRTTVIDPSHRPAIADERAAHLVPCPDIAAVAAVAAVARALDQAGPRSRVVVLPQGPLTIPHLA